MASLIQDVWFGAEPRVRGLRLGPHSETEVRVVFHPDAAMSLDDPTLRAFLEALATELEVVAFDPRFGSGRADLTPDQRRERFIGVLETIARTWESMPLVVAGHRTGGTVALAVATHPAVRGVISLAPDALLGSPEAVSFDPVTSITEAQGAVLVIVPRAGGGTHEKLCAALAASHCVTLVSAPGDAASVLSEPWPQVAAAWARHAGGA